MRNVSLILLVISCTIFACEKHDNPPPTSTSGSTTPTTSIVNLTTAAIGNITDSTATSGGTITTTGTVDITIRGVQWDTSTRFGNSWRSSNGSGEGTFSSNLTGLLPSTNYYVRAYAVNTSDTTYGDTLQLTTSYVPGKYTVTTLAGTGVSGSMDGSAGSATFHAPDGVTVDAAGNVYVADESDKIRKISGGMVSTLSNVPTIPSDVAVDSLGNIYIAMPLGFNILRLTPAGQLTTFAGSGSSTSTNGTGTGASFAGPITLDIDPAGNLYVGDGTAFRKVTPAGVVTTLLSSITPAWAVGVDPLGNVYESNRYSIDELNTGGVISFIAGGTQTGSNDGTGSAAGFGLIEELKVGPDGNLYVADGVNNKIRMITAAGVVTTIAGTGAAGATDGNSAVATFNVPTGLAIDKAGNIYVSDLSNNKIRKISPL